MDIACLLAPHFAVQVELRRQPQLAGRPLVLESMNYLTTRQRTVLDASPLARGVQPGMPLEEAVGRCRDAVVVEADMESYRQAWSDVLDSLEERCIALEDTALGQACMDIKGLDDLYGGQAKVAVMILNAAPPWLQVQVGLGPNRFTSFVAAGRAGRGSASCVEGDATTFLQGAGVESAACGMAGQGTSGGLWAAYLGAGGCCGFGAYAGRVRVLRASWLGIWPQGWTGAP